MLRPVRMSLINVLLLKEDLPEAARALMESASLEVRKAKVLTSRDSLKNIDTQTAVGDLGNLRGRIEAVARSLGIFTSSGHAIELGGLRIKPDRIHKLIEDEVSPVEREVERVCAAIENDQTALAGVDATSWILSAMEKRGIDMAFLRNPVFIGVEVGTLPSELFDHTRRSLEVAGHFVYDLGRVGARTFLCAVTTPQMLSDMRNGLKNARFESVTLRDDLVENGHFNAEAAEMEMWEVRERLTENGLALANMAKEYESKIRRWLAELRLNVSVLEAMGNFLEGDYSCLITGWIPVNNIVYLRKRLAERCEHPVELVPVDEKVLAIEGPQAVLPPTKLANPRFLRPFELIVDLYGTPGYNMINPTPFVALLFVFTFGAMFGDVGHGLILALLGAGLWWFGARKSAKSASDLGAVLAWCGLGATVFGFLYGSVFGVEQLEPLWRRPIADPAAFLFYGIIFGAIVINLGLLLNLAQRLWARQYKEAFFGEWGASTLVFYWTAILLFYLVKTGHGGSLSVGIVALAIAPSLLATAFGTQIVEHVQGKAVEEDITGALSKPVELMLSSLSNTVSFVRVPAFAINHAALMGAVFLLGGLVEGQTMTAVLAYKLNIIIGNIAVIAMEGLIVFIQTMRLQYYEFFSKFFHEQGHRFEPLSFEEGR